MVNGQQVKGLQAEVGWTGEKGEKYHLLPRLLGSYSQENTPTFDLKPPDSLGVTPTEI